LSDLSGLKRLPIDFTNEGRVAVLNYVKIHLSSGGIFELPKVVLDTGLEVGALVPRSALGEHWDDKDSRPARIYTLNGHELRCDAFDVKFLLGNEEFSGEVYVSDHAPTAILGLPLLRNFHLMLAKDDDLKSWRGPCLLMPPITQHGLSFTK
jgi:predicted aspartyl protease